MERINIYKEGFIENFPKALLDELLDSDWINIVENPKDCDFLFVPYDYFNLKKRNRLDYLDKFVELSEKFNKKIIVIAYGDSDENISIPNAYIFRTSQYKYKKKECEIIMPPYVKDLLEGSICLREKKNIPTVSFCGWAKFDNNKKYIKYLIKISLQYIKRIFGNKFALLHIQGVYFRRKLISIFRKSKNVKTSFIIRETFSGNKKTIKGSPEKIRSEYIENIKNSDFVLAPKGDGNYSLRFFEALSMGRIPIVLDTSAVLPLDDVIDYSKIAVFVDLKDAEKSSEKVLEFYNKLDEKEFKERQLKAREVFENYLKVDCFFRFSLKKLLNI